MKSWGRSLGGVSKERVVRIYGYEERRQTHEGGKTLDVNLFSDNEATAALLSGGLSNNGYGVLGAGTETVESGGAGNISVGVVQTGEGKTIAMLLIWRGVWADDNDGGSRRGRICYGARGGTRLGLWRRRGGSVLCGRGRRQKGDGGWAGIFLGRGTRVLGALSA